MFCIYWIFSLVRLTHFVPRFSLFTWTGIKGTLGRNSLKHEVFRNSRPKLFCKKSVIRNFAKVTEKHLYQSLFSNKVAGWGLELYQKGLWHRCFPVNFAKFLRTQFLQNTYGRPRLKTNFLFRISISDTRIMRKIHLKRALMTRKFVILTLVLDNDCCMSWNVGRTKINLVTSNKLYFL